MSLTGKVRVRPMPEPHPPPHHTACILLVLQVEEADSPSGPGATRWRDATVEDLQQLDLKGTLR